MKLTPLLLLAAVLCTPAFAKVAFYESPVNLSWQLSVAPMPERQFVWRQKNCTGLFVQKATLSSTTVTWEDPNVIGGNSYCYYVTVQTKEGTSGPSNIVEVQIPESEVDDHSDEGGPQDQ